MKKSLLIAIVFLLSSCSTRSNTNENAFIQTPNASNYGQVGSTYSADSGLYVGGGANSSSSYQRNGGYQGAARNYDAIPGTIDPGYYGSGYGGNAVIDNNVPGSSQGAGVGATFGTRYQGANNYQGTDVLPTVSNANIVSYNSNENIGSPGVNSGYFGAISTVQGRNEDLFIENHNKGGYIGVINANQMPNQGVGYVGAAPSAYTAPSRIAEGNNNYSGTSQYGYAGGANSQANQDLVYTYHGQNDEIPSAATGIIEQNLDNEINLNNNQNNDYPKASLDFGNKNFRSENPNNPECTKAQEEVELASKTDVLADKLFYYRKALRLCPESATYHNGLGEVFLTLNRKEDAEFEFKEALRIDSSLQVAERNLKILQNGY